MKTSRRNASKRIPRSNSKSSSDGNSSQKSVGRFGRSEELETDKESVISEYDDDIESQMSEIISILGSKRKHNNASFMSQSWQENLASQRFNGEDSQNNYGEDDEDEDYLEGRENDDFTDGIGLLTAEQRRLRDKWIQLFHKFQKNKIKTDEAFNYSLENELKLALYEWKDSGCILESLSKMYAFKVDSLTKSSYQLLHAMARGKERALVGGQEDDEDNENEDQNGRFNNEEENGKEQSAGKSKQPRIITILSSGSKNRNFNVLSEGQKQLERAEKITVEKYDIEFDVDPLFCKTSKFFDGANAALLLDQLRVDSEVSVNLGEKIEQPSSIIERSPVGITPNARDYIEKRDYRRDGITFDFQRPIDIFPELSDFKQTVIYEISQGEDDREENRIEEQFLKNPLNIRILTNKSTNFNILQSLGEADINQQQFLGDTISTEFDKQLWAEIDQAVKNPQIIRQSSRSASADKLFLQNFTPNNYLENNNKMHLLNSSKSHFLSSNSHSTNLQKHLRFDVSGDVERYEFSQDNNISQYEEDHSSTQANNDQINSASLDNSFSKIGAGDKQIFDANILNWNWGDPNQWETLKHKQQFEKKSKKDFSVLGAIKEDAAAEENVIENSTRAQLRMQQGQFKFAFDMKKKESLKAIPRKQKPKRKMPVRIPKIPEIKHKFCIPRDYGICKNRTFSMSLIGEEEHKQLSSKLISQFDEGGLSQYYILNGSQTKQNTDVYEGDEYAFDDLFSKDEGLVFRRDQQRRLHREDPNLNQSQNSYDNRNLFKEDNSQIYDGYPIINEGNSQLSQLDSSHNNTFSQLLSPRFGRAQPSFYSQLQKSQQFSQQTAKKRDVKIRDLKEQVWRCMTTSKKDSNSQDSGLYCLSQFTAQKSQSQKKQKKRRSTKDHEEKSEELEILLPINYDQSTMKFSDIVCSLPEIYNQTQSVSVQNCFISLLHLANERALRFVDQQHSEQEFLIFKDDIEEEEQNASDLVEIP